MKEYFQVFLTCFFQEIIFHNGWGAGGRGTLRGITMSEKWVMKYASFVFSIREIKKN